MSYIAAIRFDAHADYVVLEGGQRAWISKIECVPSASDAAGFVNGQEIIVDGGFEHMLMSLVPRPGFERGN